MNIDNNPIMMLVERRISQRDFRFLANKEYIKDIHTLSYKSGNDGQIAATLKLIHETEKDEKIIFYAMLEEDGKLLEFSVDGVRKEHHLVDVPRKGEVEFIFTFEDLPPGNHIIYLMTEKYVDPLVLEDEFEKLNFETYLGYYYFAIKVENSKKPPLSDNDNVIELKGDKRKKGKGNGVNITLFKDKSMLELAKTVCSGTYFLAIQNPHDYEYDAHLSLLVNYDLNQIGKMTIPQSSKVVLPITICEELLKDKQSIRFLLIGKPMREPNAYGFPERIYFSSIRLLVQ